MNDPQVTKAAAQKRHELAQILHGRELVTFRQLKTGDHAVMSLAGDPKHTRKIIKTGPASARVERTGDHLSMLSHEEVEV